MPTATPATPTPAATHGWEHRLELPLPRAEVWEHAVDVPAWSGWWPWLEVAGCDRVRVGATATARFRSPLGWAIEVEVTPTEVAPGRRIAAAVAGDLVGSADLTLHDAPGGCTAVLVGAFELGPALARVRSGLGDRVLDQGHRILVDLARRQFVASARQPVAA